MRPKAPAKPHNRDGMWYLVRAVPVALRDIDRRGTVKISTGIRVADDPRAIRARPAIRQIDHELEIYWQGLRDGRDGEARLRFDAAQKRARAIGLEYRTNQELADGPVEDILKRMKMIVDRGAQDDEAEVAAIAGGEGRPALCVDELYSTYETLNATALQDHSPRQRKKWGMAKQRAAGVLKDVIGNVQIADLSRKHALDYRDHWQKRINAGEVDIGTANKSLGHIHTMLKEIARAHRLTNGQAFAELRFKGEKKRSRPAFTAEWVQKHLLAEGALDGLNAEARAILWICADTGARPVEIANIGENIFLDAEVPYIRIVGADRVLKTVQSEREIPLVGAALAAAKLFPKGFPRYHDKGDSLSAVVNKYLDEHKLLPSPQHTLYGLRHCFEDRITAVEPPEKLVAALMGHKYGRPKYGTGPTLEQKRRWLRKIAFTPPQFGPLA